MLCYDTTQVSIERGRLLLSAANVLPVDDTLKLPSGGVVPAGHVTDSDEQSCFKGTIQIGGRNNPTTFSSLATKPKSSRQTWEFCRSANCWQLPTFCFE